MKKTQFWPKLHALSIMGLIVPYIKFLVSEVYDQPQ